MTDDEDEKVEKQDLKAEPDEKKPDETDEKKPALQKKPLETKKTIERALETKKDAKGKAKKIVPREGIAFVVMVVAGAFAIYRCSRDPDDTQNTTKTATPSSGAAASSSAAPSTDPPGLSAPIASSNVDGDVIVAGLDVPAKAIRVQRIDSADRIKADRLAITDVTWSTDSDLKVASTPEGVAITWRGLRNGKLVRQMAVLGPDLTPKGPPTEVAAASCTTRDAIWFSDGSHAVSLSWLGSGAKSPPKVELPKEKDASLICGAHRAFALLEEEERTSILTLGAPPPDSGAATGDDAGHSSGPITVLRENDFGEDEQRELSEYTVGDEVGVVRLASSGALVFREIGATGTLGALHKLKTSIPKDDDVVAVDASSKILVIVYTQDASSACPPLTGGGDTVVSTKVTALRVDRESFEESTIELSPGRCGHEIGPFFTGALGVDVSIAWAERAGGMGKARAPIVGLAHARVTSSAAPTLERIDQSADALVDGGCDSAANQCFATALARRNEANPLAPGVAKVLRYK